MKSKQKREKMCQTLRVGIGAVMIALGALVMEGGIGTALIIIGICVLVSAVAWACPCTTFLGAEKAQNLCCLNCFYGKSDTCLSQFKRERTCS